MLLAALEVGLASVCASVPIFWPVLSQRLNNIFSPSKFDDFHGPRLALNDDDSAEALTLHPMHKVKGAAETHDSVMDHLDEMGPMPQRKLSKASLGTYGYQEDFGGTASLRSHPDELGSRLSVRSHHTDGMNSRTSVRSRPDDLQSRVSSVRSHPDDLQNRITRVTSRGQYDAPPRRPSRGDAVIHEMDVGEAPMRPSRADVVIHEMDAGRDGVPPPDLNRKTWLDF